MRRTLLPAPGTVVAFALVLAGWAAGTTTASKPLAANVFGVVRLPVRRGDNDRSGRSSCPRRDRT